MQRTERGGDRLCGEHCRGNLVGDVREVKRPVRPGVRRNRNLELQLPTSCPPGPMPECNNNDSHVCVREAETSVQWAVLWYRRPEHSLAYRRPRTTPCYLPSIAALIGRSCTCRLHPSHHERSWCSVHRHHPPALRLVWSVSCRKKKTREITP